MVYAIVRCGMLVAFSIWLALMVGELREPWRRAELQFTQMAERAWLKARLSGTANPASQARVDAALPIQTRPDPGELLRMKVERFDAESGDFVAVGFMDTLMIRPAGWAFASGAVILLLVLFFPGELIFRRLYSRPNVCGGDLASGMELICRLGGRRSGLSAEALEGMSLEAFQIGFPEAEMGRETGGGFLAIAGAVRNEGPLGRRYKLLRRLYCSRVQPSAFAHRLVKGKALREDVEHLEREGRLLRDLIQIDGARVYFVDDQVLSAEAGAQGAVGGEQVGAREVRGLLLYEIKTRRGVLALIDVELRLSQGFFVDLLACVGGGLGKNEPWLIFNDSRDLGHLADASTDLRFHCLEGGLKRLNPAVDLLEYCAEGGIGGIPQAQSMLARFRSLLGAGSASIKRAAFKRT